MSITLEAPSAPTPPAAPDRGRVRPRFLVVTIVFVIAMLIAVGVVAKDRWPSAAPGIAFDLAGASAGSETPIAPGATWATAVAGDLPDVTVLAAEPVVRVGSAAVAASVVACEPVQAGVAWGAGVTDLGATCSRTLPVRDLDLSTLAGGAYLMLVVVPLDEGPISVDDIGITYRDADGEREQLLGSQVSLP